MTVNFMCEILNSTANRCVKPARCMHLSSIRMKRRKRTDLANKRNECQYSCGRAGRFGLTDEGRVQVKK